MLTRLAGASVRAALVAITVATPAVMLPDVSPTSAELSIMLAAIAAAFVIFEYGFATPSLIEFRFAAPYNRCRFAILAMLLLVSVLAIRGGENTFTSLAVASFSQSSVEFWDFARSPMRSLSLLAVESSPDVQATLTKAAACALSVATIGVFLLGLIVWSFAWPMGREKFNLWINMPTFNVGGHEPLPNLRRTALISLIFGVTFPYIAPHAALAFFGPLGSVSANNGQFLVWLVAIWCFVPAASLLRAIALFRIISLISRTTPEEA